MKFQRCSGVLLHPTSLPGKFGIGSLGKEAYNFVDFLIYTKQKLWQTLPLGPTGYGDSPYQCFSAFAGNPLLIDLEKLVNDDKLLKKEDLETSETFDDNKVDFGKVLKLKSNLYKKAFSNFTNSNNELLKIKFEIFCEKNSAWLEDYSLFMALKGHFIKSWKEWDKDIKTRNANALKKCKAELHDEIEYHKFLQYLFFKQWLELKAYANAHNVKIVGDIPIFVAFDSADAWANPEVFFFDEDRNPTKVAGVPPDYFSATGQLWGNPLYDWDKMKENNFKWWVDRIRATSEMVDIIRIDHFRGFAGYWAVPADRKDAIVGKWEKGPGADLFTTIKDELGNLPIIVEDLGVITPDVEKLRDDFSFPGMNILQFGFEPDGESVYIPHRFKNNSIVYTGTHDNDTTQGWFDKLDAKTKKYVKEYLNTDGKEITWDMIRAAWASTASIAFIPMQDILSLGSEARMNIPAIPSGNWQWRYKSKDITQVMKDKLKGLTRIYRR